LHRSFHDLRWLACNVLENSSFIYRLGMAMTGDAER
jgi:hypothetical protein